MATEQVFEKITDAFRTGLPHPGNPQRDQKPSTFVLPGFNGKGLPPELADHVTATARVVAEAVVAVIETDHEIVSKEEIAQLRRVCSDVPSQDIQVICRRCKNLLVSLSYHGDHQIAIDGRALLTRLARLGLECPHGTISITNAEN